MEHGFFGRKNLCKNERFCTLKNYIRNEAPKTLAIAAVWGRFTAGNSDKESSHVVGISLKAR